MVKVKVKAQSHQPKKLYRKLLIKDRIEWKETETQPKSLIAKTVRNSNQVISSAMDLAVAQKIILENPTNTCNLPKVSLKEMQTIPAEQIKSFLKAKETDVYKLCYTELAAGLRRGELLDFK